MSEIDDLIKKARQAQEKESTDALIAEARAKQQPTIAERVKSILGYSKMETSPQEIEATAKQTYAQTIAQQPSLGKIAEAPVYTVGHDPRLGLGANIVETMLEPTEILMNIGTGGAVGAIQKAQGLGRGVGREALAWGTYGLHDLYRGAKGFANKFLEGLGAKAKEMGKPLTSEVAADIIAASRPAERFAAEAIQEGSQPTVAAIAKNVALEKQGAKEYLETVYPQVKATTTASIAEKVPVTPEQAAQLKKLGNFTQKEIDKMTTEEAASTLHNIAMAEAKAKGVTGLTESEKLAAPILTPTGERVGAPLGGGAAAGGAGKPPPKLPRGTQPPEWQAAPNAMSKEDWDFIRTTPKPGGMGLAEGMWEVGKEKASRTARAAMMLSQPPHWTVGHEPTGRLAKMYQLMDESVRKYNSSLDVALKDFHANLTVPKGSKDAETLAVWLDTYEHAPGAEFGKLIPKPEWNAASQELKESFLWMREAWDKMGDNLVAKGLMEPTKRLKAYFFHMFPKEDIKLMWDRDLAIINNSLEKVAAGTKKMPADKLAKLNRDKKMIEEHIANYEKRGTVLYDYIPKGIEVPFLKSRADTPMEGWLLDPHRAGEYYIHLYHKKLYKEPVVKEAIELMKGMEPDWKAYSHRLVKSRYLGIGDPIMGPIKEFEHVLTGLQFVSSMGGNIPSALRNLTQNINTVVEAGPINTSRGFWRSLTSKGRAEWVQSGHAIEIPGLTFESVSALRKIEDKLAYFFSKAEAANRRIAYAAGLEKAEKLGLSGIEATRMADDVLKKTQFYYGKLGAPLAADIPGASIAMQFGTYTLNQLNLFHHWLKTNPEKFLFYLLYANALSYGAEGLGLDLRGTVGLGIDWSKAFDSYMHWLQDKPERAAAEFRMATPAIGGIWEGGAPSGVMPSGFAPVVDTGKRILDGDWAKVLPVTLRRIYEGFQAIREGEVESPALPSPMEGIPGVEAKKGLAVRQVPLGTAKMDVKTILTPWELGARTFIARPMAESQSQEAATFQRILNEQMQEKKEYFINNVAPLLLGNKLRPAQPEVLDKWLASQKPEITTYILEEMTSIMKNEALAQRFSSDFRLALRTYLNTKGLQYRIGVFSDKERVGQLP